MRILLFVVMVASVLGSSHPAVGRYSAQVRQVNRFLKGPLQKAGEHYGGKTGEVVGGAAGNALGTGVSVTMFGSITGGDIGVKAGRNGMGAGGRIAGEYIGAVCLAKVCGAAGRVADKFTKSGRQAQAVAAKAKKEQAEALKKPVLYNGGRYQQAKLSRTGSSPGLLHGTGTWSRKETTNPGGASTSGTKPAINKGKAPMNAGGASTSGSHSPRKGGEAPTQIVKSMRIGQNPTLRKRKL
ncbi:hypothetical protein LEN26_005092 [Aphanomyces euteiches]|nr:hypothetical protein LEN26_005092 [Aphanomyces euteiches]